MTLPLDHYLAQLDAEGDAFEQLALNGDLSTSVPTCPDWDVAELIGHTAAVYNWAAETLRVGRAGRDALVPPEGDLVAGFRQRLDALRLELVAAGGDRDVWTFLGDGKSSFWYRRMAHETAMHRVDAQLALTESNDAVDGELAVDGIDELFDVYYPWRLQGALAGDGETLHLHATDVEGGEWLLTRDSDGVAVTKTHAKGDVAARGSASDLLLLAWSRLSPSSDRLEVFGEESLLEEFQKAISI